jgi:hypothetical protein
MSRLDSFIRRLEAQRILLNWAVDEVQRRQGIILELGLGNGRTYDHLREQLPGREIYAFDRMVNANPRSIPPQEYLVLGDFAETLPPFAKQRPERAALLHYDAGLGNPEANARQIALLTPMLPPLVMPGGLILSDQRLNHPQLRAQALPAAIPPDRYFVYMRD